MRWSFTQDKRRKRKNKYTRLELKYYCWVAFNYAPSFLILKQIVYATFCGLIWLLQGLRSRKLLDHTAWTTQIWRACFVPRVETLIVRRSSKIKKLFRLMNPDKMNNRLKARQFQLARRPISDWRNSVNYARRKKKLPHRLKAIFRLHIVLFETAGHIFTNEWPKQHSVIQNVFCPFLKKDLLF